MNQTKYKAYKDEYDKFLISINPVELYVKERCDTAKNKNPRYDLGTTGPDCTKGNYCSLKINYYNNPMTVGFVEYENNTLKHTDPLPHHDKSFTYEIKRSWNYHEKV